MKMLRRCCLLMLVSAVFGFSMVANAAITDTKKAQVTALINQYYAALNKKDMTLFFSLMTPNVTHDVNQGESEQGIEKFKVFMQKEMHSFNQSLDDIVVMVADNGKYAAARWVDHGVYVKDFPEMNAKAKNQKFTLIGVHVFEVENGKITRVSTYFNETDFMKQMQG